MKREIVKFGASVLRQQCAPISEVDSEVRSLVDDLFDSMRAAEGVGLAAPQIGIARRVCVIDVSAQQPDYPPIALINPRIVSDVGTQVGEEGCLSFPDLYGDVKRAESVTVEALNLDGETFTTEGSGFYARALQHELDHLNGVLFVDHLSSLKRQLMRSALKRLKKEGEAWQKENS
jgi:peptide deformylase